MPAAGLEDKKLSSSTGKPELTVLRDSHSRSSLCKVEKDFRSIQSVIPTLSLPKGRNLLRYIRGCFP